MFKAVAAFEKMGDRSSQERVDHLSIGHGNLDHPCPMDHS
jgi:hypothetical protein